MTETATKPFAVTFTGEPRHDLERLITWLCSDQRFRSVLWRIDDIETNTDSLDLDNGDVVASTELGKLLSSQIIELDLVGMENQRRLWRVIVRDGATVDLLGHGDLPHPGLIGASFEVRDATNFRWS